MKYILPQAGWPTALAKLLNTLPDGSEIVVDTEAKKELAERGMERMGRKSGPDGITITVEAA
jgi:hypothetical protein